jgi:hypothetical protein
MMRRFARWVARAFAKPRHHDLLIEPAPEALGAWRALLGIRRKSHDS